MMNTDFKSLEIYIAAGISQDQNTLQVLLNGADVHAETARSAFGIPDDQEVPKALRTQAKSVNFGSLYGETAVGIADTLTKDGAPTTVEEAQDLFDKIMGAKPQMKEEIERTQAQAQSKHYVETISGFRRRLNMVNSIDKGTANRALRQSFNARVQGSGAYCTNNALIMADALFQKLNLKSKIVMTVHDSIVVDCHPDEVKTVAKLMKASFENLNIPALVNNKINDLDVPDKYNLGNGYFRLPLVGEVELGANYNDDIDYDQEVLDQYVNVYQACVWQYKRIKAKEIKNTALGKLPKDLDEAELKVKTDEVENQYQANLAKIAQDEQPFLKIDIDKTATAG